MMSDTDDLIIDIDKEVVIGIDADTRRIAYAVINITGTLERFGTVARRDSRGRYATDYVDNISSLFGLLDKSSGRVFRVYVEDCFLASGAQQNVRTLKSLCRVTGQIELFAHMAGIQRPAFVEPGDWQFHVLGQTVDRAKLKAMSMEHAREFTDEELTEHEADAICIADYAWRKEVGSLKYEV